MFLSTFLHEITLKAVGIDNIGCLEPFLPLWEHFWNRVSAGLNCASDLTPRLTYKRSESSANTVHSLHPWKNGTLPDNVKRKWATNMVQSRVPAYPPSLPCKREDCRVHGGLSHRSQTPRGWVDHLKQLQIDQWVVVYLIKSDAMKNEFPDLIRGRNPKATLVTPDKAQIVLIASFVW